MSPANFNSSWAASAAVHDAVPVVKQIGWPVSTSSAKNVWATLAGRCRSLLRWSRMCRLLELRMR
jgi:hypothetical protein